MKKSICSQKKKKKNKNTFNRSNLISSLNSYSLIISYKTKPLFILYLFINSIDQIRPRIQSTKIKYQLANIKNTRFIRNDKIEKQLKQFENDCFIAREIHRNSACVYPFDRTDRAKCLTRFETLVAQRRGVEHAAEKIYKRARRTQFRRFGAWRGPMRSCSCADLVYQ